MFNLDCFSARAINIMSGVFLMFLGVLLVFSGFSFLPVFGFFLAAVVVGLSLVFLFAPPDKVCFLPSNNTRRSKG